MHICAVHHKQLTDQMGQPMLAHEPSKSVVFKGVEIPFDTLTEREKNPSKIQQFNSGATRSSDGHKFDYEGFQNPQAEFIFADYMHTHRFQRDGSIRDSDNWQKGIPLHKYMKSLVRHMFDAWRLHRGYAVTDLDTGNPATMSDLMCAIRFNAMGYLKEIHDPSPINGGKE